MDNKNFHESKIPSSLKAAIKREENQTCLSYPEREQARPKVNSQPSTETDKGTFNYPQSVQSDLFNYLKPQQRKAVRPYFRIIKRPYQVKLCVSLLDYLEGKGLDSFEEPVLAKLQETIVQECSLRPLAPSAVSGFRFQDSSEPKSIGTIIKSLFPQLSSLNSHPSKGSLNRNENPSSLNSQPSTLNLHTNRRLESLNPKP